MFYIVMVLFLCINITMECVLFLFGRHAHIYRCGDDVHDVKYALGDFYIPMQFYGHYA